MSTSSELDSLVERAKRGDAEAVERLLVACEPALQRLARRTCPPADAEDAVQEVLMRVTSAIGGLRLAGAFVVWSMRMLVRECLRFKRRAARFVLGEPEETSARPQQPAQLFVGASSSTGQHDALLRRDLARSLSCLDESARVVLLHRDVLGHTGPETAALLNISLEATKSRLRRARGELRKHYRALSE